MQFNSKYYDDTLSPSVILLLLDVSVEAAWLHVNLCSSSGALLFLPVDVALMQPAVLQYKSVSKIKFKFIDNRCLILLC